MVVVYFMSLTLEDFKKLEIKIGKIISAEKIEGTDKLLKLMVDFGPSTSSGQVSSRDSTDASSANSGSTIRQIVSGIAEEYTPEFISGKKCPFLINLETRTIKGIKSQGMILAVIVDGRPVLLHPDAEVPPGSKVA